MKSYVKRNLCCLMVSRVCFATMALSIPVITEYWKFLGMQASAGYWLQIVFAIGLVVLEVLTGKVSDIWGRKNCLIASGILGLVGAQLYANACSFEDLVAAELLLALSLALNSGTEEALLYESFSLDKKLGIYHRKSFQFRWKLLFRVGFICMVPSSAAAGYLYEVHPRITWWILSFTMLIRTICYCFLSETHSKPESLEDRSRHILKATSLLFFESKSLRWITFAICVIAGVNATAVWSYTPSFQSEQWNLIEIGWVFALFHLIAGLSSIGKQEVKAQGYLEVINCCLVLGVVSTLGFFILASSGGVWIILGAVPQQLVRGGLTWIFADFYQSRTPDHIRSTLGSVRSAAGLLIYALLLLPYALLIDHIGRSNLLLILGTFLLLFVMVVSFKLRSNLKVAVSQ